MEQVYTLHEKLSLLLLFLIQHPHMGSIFQIGNDFFLEMDHLLDFFGVIAAAGGRRQGAVSTCA